MRPLRIIINCGVVVIPLTLLSVGSVRLLQRELRYLNSSKRLAGILSTEATRIVGREVRVGNVQITGNLWGLSAENKIILSDVVIAEGKTLQTGAFVRARKIIVSYNLKQLLLEKDLHIPLVEALHVDSPQVVLLRDPHGQWNFASLIQKKGPSGRPFVSAISFTNGQVSYQDQHFPHLRALPPQPFVTHLAALNGVVQVRPDKSLAFDVSGQGPEEQFASLHVVGTAVLAPLRANVRLTAAQVNLPFAGARLLSPQIARVTSGRANVDLSAIYLPPPAQKPLAFDPQYLDVQGNAQISHVAVNSPHLAEPISLAQAAAAFTNQSLTAHVQARIAGADVTLNGSFPGWKILRDKTALADAPIQAQGQLRQVNLARIVQNLRVAGVTELLPANVLASLNKVHGVGNVDFQAAGSLAAPTLTARTQFDTLEVGGYQVGRARANVLYAPHTLTADVQGNYAQGQLQARANLGLDGNHAYQVEAHGRSLQLAAFQDLLHRPVRGMGDLDVRAQGSQDAPPQLQAQARIKNLALNNQTLQSAYLEADTVGSTLILRRLRIDDPKGYAFARGTLNLKAPEHPLDIRISGNDLHFDAITKALQRTLPADKQVQVAGVGYVRGHLQGALKDLIETRPNGAVVGFRQAALPAALKALSLEGNVSAFGLEAKGVALDTVDADFNLTEDQLQITRGTARQYPAVVDFKGDIDQPFQRNAPLRIAGRLENLDVAQLMKNYGQGGKTNNPIDVTGTLNADLSITGTTNHPRIVADNLDLQDATLKDMPLEDATGRVVVTRSGLQITNAGIRVAGGDIQLNGRVEPSGSLALHLSGDGLDLAALGDIAPEAKVADIKGTAQFQGDVNGTLQDPRATLTLNTQGLNINNTSLGEITGKLAYHDKEITAANFNLGNPLNPLSTGGSFAFSNLGYNLDTGALRGKAAIREVAIQQVRELVQNSAYAHSDAGQSLLTLLNKITGPIQGAVSGTLAFSGTAENPVAEVTWNARDIRIENHAITSLTGTARVTKDALVVPSPATPEQAAHLESPDATIDASANAQFMGPLSGQVSAYNVNLNFLQHWLSQNITKDIGGTGDLFMVASGKTASPVLDVSVNLRNLTYDPKQFGLPIQTLDRFDVDHAQIKEGAITADHIAFLKRDTKTSQTYRGRASGSVGFTWTPPQGQSFIPPDAKLNFTADIPQQSLQFISAFVPNALGDTTGTFSANVTASGTLDKPNIVGSLGVQAPKLRASMLGTGLKNLDAGFRFEGSRLVVDHFSALPQVYDPKTGKELKQIPRTKLAATGQPITLAGSIPLLGEGNPNESLHIRAPQFVFAETPLPGFHTGSATGQADIDLTLSGSLQAPKLTGAVVASNGQIALPGDYAGLSGNVVFLPINPTFDVHLRLGNNVNLSNALLTTRTSGDIHLAGKLSSPNLEGTIALNEGKLKLPTASFKIISPSFVTLRYPVQEYGEPGLGINIDLQAQTKLTATPQGGFGPKRYTVTVTARGPLTGQTLDPVTGQSKLALHFETDPPDLAYNQQELLTRIATGLTGIGNFNQVGQNPSQAFANVLLQGFTGAFLPGMFDEFANRLGFEDLSINYDPVQRLNLSISRQLFGPLYVTYLRGLSAESEFYDIKLSLRFKNNYQLSFDQETDENNQRTNRVLLEGVWKF